MFIFDTRVAGIPCKCGVTSYYPARDWKQHTFPGAGPGDCDPPDPGEFEFSILDRKGYKANWLELKLTKEISDRLQEEYLEKIFTKEDYDPYEPNES